MSEPTMRPDANAPDLASSQPTTPGPVRPPKAEDEGLSVQEIKWIPVIVPLVALMMLLAAAAVLSTA